MTESSPRRIAPARPDAGDDGAGYMPKVPWRWIALGTMTIAIVAFAYWWNEQSKAQALRAGIVRLHQETLREAADGYVSFRAALVDRITAAAAIEPKGIAEPRLSISGLRGTPGLYLRLPRAEATNPESIAKAASVAETDVIASCMGLAPLSARGLFERGSFLLPEWIEEAQHTDSVIRLRVIDDELARRVKRDLPSVLSLLHSRWFLLVLDHGSRDRDPVDVFLWDLREDKPLLEARVQSKGVLMSARVRLDGASAPRLTPGDAHRSGAHDCSIASQIKQLAGTPAPVVAN